MFLLRGLEEAKDYWKVPTLCGHDMSFPLHRSEVKKDEEELPAREGDPLLPAGGRGTRPDSTASPFVDSNAAHRGSSNLRARRSSRSPSHVQKAGGSTTSQLTSISPKTTTTNKREHLANSQMVNADDDSSTTSSAIFYAATAESSAANNNVDQSKRYIDFIEMTSEGQAGGPPHNSLASGTAQSDEISQHRHHLLPSSIPRRSPTSAQQSHLQPGVLHNSGIPPYEPPPYRPPSPDEGRTDARSTGSSGSDEEQPQTEIPEEIYAVRKAALKVMKPLTKTWVSIMYAVPS